MPRVWHEEEEKKKEEPFLLVWLFRFVFLFGGVFWGAFLGWFGFLGGGLVLWVFLKIILVSLLDPFHRVHILLYKTR